MNVTVLGGGSFGTALAIHLAKQHEVKVWEFSKERVEVCNFTRVNDLLSKVKIPFNVKYYNDIEASLKDSEMVFMAVPSNNVKSTIESVKPFIGQDVLIVNCSKGFCEETGQAVYQLIEQVMEREVIVLGGPMHAEEVAEEHLSGAIIASKDIELVKKVKHRIQDHRLKLYISDDPLGVALGSSLKNILAILLGITDGLGLGDNTKAYIFTKGLAEMSLLGESIGAKKETFYGLSGLGDLFVTATSKHSRNRHVGEELGKGKELDKILENMSMVAEGVVTTKIAYNLAQELDLPIIKGLYLVLFEGKTALDLINEI